MSFEERIRTTLQHAGGGIAVDERHPELNRPQLESPSFPRSRLLAFAAGFVVVAAIGVVTVVLGLANRSDPFTPVGLIPGLTAENEIELIEIDPSPSDEYFYWDSAYSIEGIDRVDVGRTGPGFWAAAGRDSTEEWRCANIPTLDSGRGGGCAPVDDPRPDVGGQNAGGLDVLAWSWANVPPDAVVVVFTEPDGRVTWQRPSNQFVIFLDAVGDDCGCRMDAYDTAGNLIESANVLDS